MTHEYDQLKHLEFVQGAINRMAANSFTIRAWAVTVVTAVLALAIDDRARPIEVSVSYIPIITFAILDAYYVRQERLFRCLFNDVRTDPGTVLETQGPYSMSTRRYDQDRRNTYGAALASLTVLLFFVPLFAIATTFLTVGRSRPLPEPAPTSSAAPSSSATPYLTK